ncbi:unnamed protein product, partial [Closterium sp. NIES-53]
VYVTDLATRESILLAKEDRPVLHLALQPGGERGGKGRGGREERREGERRGGVIERWLDCDRMWVSTSASSFQCWPAEPAALAGGGGDAWIGEDGEKAGRRAGRGVEERERAAAAQADGEGDEARGGAGVGEEGEAEERAREEEGGVSPNGPVFCASPDLSASTFIASSLGVSRARASVESSFSLVGEEYHPVLTTHALFPPPARLSGFSVSPNLYFRRLKTSHLMGQFRLFSVSPDLYFRRLKTSHLMGQFRLFSVSPDFAASSFIVSSLRCLVLELVWKAPLALMGG